MATGRQSYSERIERGIARYQSAHPDASYAEAKRFARGHGSTPEHGKIRTQEVAGREIIETRSDAAAGRLLSAAAADGQRVTVTVTLKNGEVSELFTNPKHGRGMDADAMREQMRSSGLRSFKVFLADNSGKNYEGNDDPFDADDIADIQFEVV